MVGRTVEDKGPFLPGGPQRAREGSRELDWRGLWRGGHKAAWGQWEGLPVTPSRPLSGLRLLGALRDLTALRPQSKTLEVAPGKHSCLQTPAAPSPRPQRRFRPL